MPSTLALVLLIAGSLCLATFVATRAWNHPPARWFLLFTLGYVFTDLAALVDQQGTGLQAAWLALFLLSAGLLLAQIGLLLLFAALFAPRWWQGSRPVRWIVLPYLVIGVLLMIDVAARTGLFVTIGQEANGHFRTLTSPPAGWLVLGLLAGGWLVHVALLVVTAVRRREFRPLIGVLTVALVITTFTGYLLGVVIRGTSLNALAFVPVILVLAYAVFRTRLFTPNEAGIEQALRVMGEAVVVWDQSGRCSYANPRAVTLGFAPGQDLAATLAQAGLPAGPVDGPASAGAPAILSLNGSRVAVTFTPVSDLRGRKRGTLLLGRDITDLELRTAELDAERTRLAGLVRQLETEQAERAALTATMRALSLPVIPLLEGVLVLPLVGDFDTLRAEEFSGVLLKAIERERARLVLIDITGIPVLDSVGAATLLRATHAAGLLGARCMLVGIRPEIAQALVALGISLDTLATAATLQQGLGQVLAKR